MYVLWFVFFFFFKQKTAYEMRISDWSSDVCSSDLASSWPLPLRRQGEAGRGCPRFALIRKTPLPNPPLPSQGREQKLAASAAPTGVATPALFCAPAPLSTSCGRKSVSTPTVITAPRAGITNVRRHPPPARDPAQHGQRDPPVRQHRRVPAPGAAAGLRHGRPPAAPRRPGLPRERAREGERLAGRRARVTTPAAAAPPQPPRPPVP